MLDIKKSIFLDDKEIPEIKEDLNIENDEFNNLLQTKESKEFANRLRASVLGNSTFGQNKDNNLKILTNNEKRHLIKSHK